MSDRSADQRAVDEMGYQQLGSRCRMRIPPENRNRFLQLAARWLFWSGLASPRQALLSLRVGQVPQRQFACFLQSPRSSMRPRPQRAPEINENILHQYFFLISFCTQDGESNIRTTSTVTNSRRQQKNSTEPNEAGISPGGDVCTIESSRRPARSSTPSKPNSTDASDATLRSMHDQQLLKTPIERHAHDMP